MKPWKRRWCRKTSLLSSPCSSRALSEKGIGQADTGTQLWSSAGRGFGEPFTRFIAPTMTSLLNTIFWQSSRCGLFSYFLFLSAVSCSATTLRFRSSWEQELGLFWPSVGFSFHSAFRGARKNILESDSAFLSTIGQHHARA